MSRIRRSAAAAAYHRSNTSCLSGGENQLLETSDTNSSRKDGTLQKIGDFLQSSPTLLGSKGQKQATFL
ncbi:hypothetical protein XENOCAPTIV_000254 [Xenoophorus captivus]|uniref:Uncharacterized protein n=1 Tax=Xenoophorus captivus TaxID=1517983 RepID=A0ABV0REP0_9TELE